MRVGLGGAALVQPVATRHLVVALERKDVVPRVESHIVRPVGIRMVSGQVTLGRAAGVRAVVGGPIASMRVAAALLMVVRRAGAGLAEAVQRAVQRAAPRRRRHLAVARDEVLGAARGEVDEVARVRVVVARGRAHGKALEVGEVQWQRVRLAGQDLDLLGGGRGALAVGGRGADEPREKGVVVPRRVGSGGVRVVLLVDVLEHEDEYGARRRVLHTQEGVEHEQIGGRRVVDDGALDGRLE